MSFSINLAKIAAFIIAIIAFSKGHINGWELTIFFLALSSLTFTWNSR